MIEEQERRDAIVRRNLGWRPRRVQVAVTSFQGRPLTRAFRQLKLQVWLREKKGNDLGIGGRTKWEMEEDRRRKMLGRG